MEWICRKTQRRSSHQSPRLRWESDSVHHQRFFTPPLASQYFFFRSFIASLLLSNHQRPPRIILDFQTHISLDLQFLPPNIHQANGFQILSSSKYSADQTSYINYIKPLIFAAELHLPHVISVIDTHEEWFYAIHPERYVPSLQDRDPVTGEDVTVFEETACLQYLADRF